MTVVTAFDGAPFIEQATCPHCLGRTGDGDSACCVCRGARVLRTWSRLVWAVQNIWARVGCGCRACQAIGLAREATS